MAALDQLPIEIHHSIFGYLDLVEISTCRLVSKKLNEIVKAFRVSELLVYSSNWERKSFFFYDGKPIYPFDTVSNRKVSVLSSTSIDLRYLKRLCLFGMDCDEFSLEVINRFTNLVHLELLFKVKEHSKGSKTQLLKLNALKYLYIHFGFPVYVEFDTPSLESVAFDNKPPGSYYADQPVEKIRFATPSTVKKLYTFQLLLDELPRNFGDLELLQCDLLAGLDLDHILSAFPALKALDIVTDKGSFEKDCNDVLDRIMRRREQLRPSLRISFNRIKLCGGRPIESYGFDKESSLEIQIKHASSPDQKFNVDILDYNELLSLTKGGFPTGFRNLQPFRYIETIVVNDQVDDQDALLNFLLNCVNLSILELNNSSLDSEFFEKLPLFTSLKELEIKAKNRDLQLNYRRFIFRITNLVNLITDQNLDIDLLRDLMQRAKFIAWLVFLINDQEFWIKKLDKDLYKLSREAKGSWKTIKEEINCDDLIDYFK